MSYSYRPAVREGVSLFIGLGGPTGSGKTFSALELATGIAGGQRFGVIDTERGRARHYADQFAFDVVDLVPPFRPQAYADAIDAGEKAGYPVLVVDQASHEHAGEGGLLDWHDELLAEMVERKRKFAEEKGWQFNEWQTAEANKMRAWIEPKMAHKRMVQHLLTVKPHLIFCFRAEEKVKMGKDDKGKTEIAPADFRSATPEFAAGVKGWGLICEKNLPFEMTCSFLMLADNPGVPVPIKLQAQHRPFFPDGKPITRACGAALAAWARGSAAPAAAASGILQPLLDRIGKAKDKPAVDALWVEAQRLTLSKTDLEKVRAACRAKAATFKQPNKAA